MRSIDWDSLGYGVSGHFEQPRAALDAIISQKPDVVFTDIRMPGIDGFELIRRCRENGADSLFVILSSYSDFELIRQAIKVSVLDYCLKPVNPDDLSSLLIEIRQRLDQKYADSCPVLPEKEWTAVTDDNFEKILAYIRQNLDHKLTLNSIAEKFSFNRNYMCYLFKKNINSTFVEYVTGLRIEQAKNLLSDPSLSIYEIAQIAGLKDYYYFNKLFKKAVGLTPAAYRRGCAHNGTDAAPRKRGGPNAGKPAAPGSE